MRRVIWTGVVYSLGLSTSFYMQKRMRRAVQRVAPEHVRADVSAKSKATVQRAKDTIDRAREVVIDLQDAAHEGVGAMQRERADLLVEFDADDSMHSGSARNLRPDTEEGRGFRPLH
ncbi:MAG: hypothetical protein P8L46_15725 [Acidimicrobiales bacterium]|nr:hypothetical protein [Acidimicrobiales bacterium]MDG2219489.1 hypothetical protein [Acidimicrobiales bacterium]